MKNLLRMIIIAYTYLIFNTEGIEITFSSVGYSIISYVVIFNGVKWLKREVLGV